MPLLAQARAGDSAALAAFLTLTCQHLEGPLRARLRGGWAEAWTDDVLQETLVAILRGYTTCRATSEGEAWAWIWTLARREAATLFRREGPRAKATVPLHEHLEEPARTSPGWPPRLSPHVRTLRTVVEKLDGPQERLLWLRYGVGATWAEVGQALGGISPAAAKRRGQRLLARLRRRLLGSLPTR